MKSDLSAAIVCALGRRLCALTRSVAAVLRFDEVGSRSEPFVLLVSLPYRAGGDGS